jgi:hypothetical protein
VTLFAFLFTEFLVNVFAIGDVVAGKNYFRWPALPSTKTVVSGQELTQK